MKLLNGIVAFIFVIVFYSFFPTNSAEAESAQTEFTAQQQEAMDHLNELRTKAGLAPVTLNPYLNKAAENHAKYIIINNTQSTGLEVHLETPGLIGFTGTGPYERVSAVGGSDLIPGEVVVTGSDSGSITSTKAIDFWMDTAYHRALIFSPDTKEIGIGIYKGTAVLNMTFSEDHSKEIALFPYDHMQNVGLSFDGGEIPDPLMQFGVRQSGFIISFTTDYDELIRANISDGQNQPVLYNIEQSTFGPKTIFLFPKYKLKYDETYTVMITYKVDGMEKTKKWSFSTKGNPYKHLIPEPAQSKIFKFVDYKSEQYWSEAMKWAVDDGIIQGFVEKNNTGGTRNLIKPYQLLTEAQFLAVLYRYYSPMELDNTARIDTGYWASVPYQLADRYGLPTNASLLDRSQASQPITRGKMAQLLVSQHKGVTVSEREAVQFLYDSGIADGYTDAKTYESFGPNNTLIRAHIVTFMKKYDDFLKVNGKERETTTDGIKVRYGNHAYFTNRQKEYDESMGYIDYEIQNVNTPSLAILENQLQRYQGGGEIYTFQQNGMDRLKKAGATDNTIKLAAKGLNIATNLDCDKEADTNIHNLYYMLIPEQPFGCASSYAEVYSAVFDSLGFNTMIMYDFIEDATYTYVELNGKWNRAYKGEFSEINKEVLNRGVVFSQPTYGPALEDNPTPEPWTPSAYISNLDIESEIVTIMNETGGDLDISGWSLISKSGNHRYEFPKGSVLEPASSIKVVSGPTASNGNDQQVWTNSIVWDKSGDTATLYNAKGRIVSQFAR